MGSWGRFGRRGSWLRTQTLVHIQPVCPGQRSWPLQLEVDPESDIIDPGQNVIVLPKTENERVITFDVSVQLNNKLVNPFPSSKGLFTILTILRTRDS